MIANIANPISAAKPMKHYQVTLIPMGQPDLPILQGWFEDKELRHRLGGMLPLQKYFDYVQSESNYFAWMAYDGDVPVGAAFIQIEPGEPQSCAFLVHPELRSQGYGRLILQQLMAQPEVGAVKKWEVGIEGDNITSQRCMAAVGFVPESGVEDEEGLVQYTFEKS
jgi:GNAT superfamily N-acetyltransferase